MRALIGIALLPFCTLVAGCQTRGAPSTDAPAKQTAAPPVAPGAPKAALGQPAPDFTLPDLDGKTVKLSDFRGKTVVLEWFNPGCPFVKRNHTEGPLKDMAARVSKNGVVWLAINSGAPGKQGHGADENGKARQAFGMSHPVLLDESGAVGKLYGAERTPHMYVIDENGTLVYRGAIDNAPDGDPMKGDKVINYVGAALEDLAAKRAVTTPEVEAYGCSMKYAN